MGSNFSLLNRYNYEGKKMETQFGLNIYRDQKDGGQVSRLRNQNYYDVSLLSQHIDLYAKTGFFLKKPMHSVGIVYNFKYHTNESIFGLKSFKGEEKRGYVNAIYDGIIGFLCSYDGLYGLLVIYDGIIGFLCVYCGLYGLPDWSLVI